MPAERRAPAAKEHCMRRTVLILAIILVAGPARADRNWPQFLGPRANGISDATDLPLEWSETSNIKWKTPIHDRGWSSPVVWDDQIWMTTATADGKQMFAVAVHRRTGEILYDIKVFTVEEPEEIHALNSYASPTPVIEAGRVYVHFGTYGTMCLDTATGKPLWSRRDLNCNHFRGPGSSPILFGNLLILHYDGFDVQFIVALDKTTGRTVWKTDRSTEFGNIDGDLRKAYCTPLITRVGGRLQMISPGAKAAMAYDPNTGEELWKVRYGGFSNASRPFFGHGLAFVNTGFGRPQLWAVRPDGHGDVTDTHVVWRVTKSVPAKPTPVLVDDLITMVDDRGIASCIEARTGKTVWRNRLPGPYSASPLYAEGRIYFFNHDDTTTVIRAGRQYEVLAVNKLDDGCMASPAVVGKAIFLRTRTHLYRIEL